MEFWQWVLLSFNGRISRKYYWYAAIILFVINAVVMGIIFGTSSAAITSGDLSQMSFIGWVLYIIVGIIGIWVGLAVSIKRWHDRGKSGWWILIVLVPIIGSIWALVELGFLAGTPGPNAYGTENTLPGDAFQSTSTM